METQAHLLTAGSDACRSSCLHMQSGKRTVHQAGPAFGDTGARIWAIARATNYSARPRFGRPLFGEAPALERQCRPWRRPRRRRGGVRRVLPRDSDDDGLERRTEDCLCSFSGMRTDRECRKCVIGEVSGGRQESPDLLGAGGQHGMPRLPLRPERLQQSANARPLFVARGGQRHYMNSALLCWR